jgi:hypothetical protein
MASVNWIITEIANSEGIPNNVGFIEAMREVILHVRNEWIRQQYEQHRYIDKAMQNRIPITLIDVPDGDVPPGLGNMIIKRSKVVLPRATRLDNNTPFTRVSTTGAETNVVIAFVKETQVQFVHAMPHFCLPTYDYINGHIYIYANPKAGSRNDFNVVQVEAAFEYNLAIIEELFHADDGLTYDIFDDEAFIPEDAVSAIKKMAIASAVFNKPYETNENVDKVIV